MGFTLNSNSLAGLQGVYDGGTPAQKAAFQASVSGDVSSIDVTQYGVPTNGADAYTAINVILSAVKTGGIKARRLVFPWTASGYKTSQEILIDFGPIWLHFEADLVGTFTTKQNVLKISGPSISSPIRGILLTGNGRAKIDGNAPNITPYMHNPSDTEYGTVLFKWVKDFYVSGLWFDRGLVNSFRTFQCGNGLVEWVRASGAANDNGLSIDSDPATYSPTNQETWANVRVRHAVAFGNNDYGITAFDATNVVFEHCHSYSNGQMSDPNGVGGGFSYEDSFSSPKGKSDYRGRFINCHAYANTGNGFFVTADGVEIDSESTAILNTYDDATKPDAPQQFGHGIAGIGARKFKTEARCESNAKAGVKLLGSSGHFVDADIGGKLNSNSQRGLDAQGVARLRVLPTIAVESNGMGSVANREGIYVGNASLNNGGGTVYVDGGEISLNGAAALKIEYANRAFVNGITGYNPGRFSPTAAGVQVANASLAIISGVVIDGQSSQQYVASISSTTTGGIFGCSGRSIVGGVTNTATTKLVSYSA